MKIFIGKIVSIIANLIPTTNFIVFHSYPDYSDNPYALCLDIIKRGIDQTYRLIWFYDERNKRELLAKRMVEDGVNAKLVYRKSFLGLWYYIRSRYVFVSHGSFDFVKLKQHNDKNINLWHGMPLKLLGASEENKEPCSLNFNYTIATSKVYQKIMAEAFACDTDKVLLTGQPRCDLLFEKTDWFSKKGINKDYYNQVGIWMPTFRKSVFGEIRLDGTFSDNCISFLNFDKLKELDSFLKNNRTLLLVKIHLMDALQNASFPEFSNIVIIKPSEFNSQLYPLLGECDFLLTDYSSVFVDYQITHKPMAFVMNDIASYKNNRGFYFNNLEESLPGPILDNYKALCDFIEKPFVKENGMKYNDFFDNHSSDRVLKELGLL